MDKISLLANTDTFIQGASIPQAKLTCAALRFADIELEPSKKSIHLLKRAFINDSPENRRLWWETIRACRRRSLRAWEQTALAAFLGDANPQATLGTSTAKKVEAHATLARLATALAAHSLSPLDCFDTFDIDGDGTLTLAELSGGLKWLLSRAPPAQVLALARYLDTNGDNLISRSEFDAALKPIMSRLPSSSSSSSSQALPSGKPTLDLKTFHQSVSPTSESDKDNNKLSQDSIRKVSISIQPFYQFDHVWDSRGCLTQEIFSVWQPVVDMGPLAPKNKLYIPIGFYGSDNLNKPKKSPRPKIIQLEAPGNLFGRSSINDELPILLDVCFPPPIGYHRIFEASGRKNFYVWKPDPPETFIAMGIVATTDDAPPPLETIRCVPKSFTTLSNKAKFMWEPQGSQGSLWRVGRLGLLAVSESKTNPPEQIYDLLPDISISDAIAQIQANQQSSPVVLHGGKSTAF
mmetsp:Transcript_5367/g.6871  ORF Transcript_5367/g.6871 Transcript_5367/m.6871 type:complete len:464 (+) Transcript_5367:756-2147(+)